MNDQKTMNDLVEGEVIVEIDEDKVTAHKEVGIRGNYTYDDNPFAHDLYPGENIVQQQHVAIGSPALSWQQKLLILLTCGLYFLYLQYCACCHPKHLYGGRAKMAVTTHGRVLLWDSQIGGAESAAILCGLIPGFKNVGSVTKIATFSLRKLSYVERGYARENCFFGLCCCPTYVQSSLRLFFNDYPAQSHVDAMQFSMLPRNVTMSKLYSIPNTYLWFFGFWRMFGMLGGFKLSQFVTSIHSSIFSTIDSCRARAMYERIGWGTLNVLEIFSPFNDKLKHDGSDWTSLLRLEQTIMEMRNPPTCIHAKPDVDPEKWQWVNEPMFIVDGPAPGRANLRQRDLSLLKDEHVVDVFPARPSWSCGDIMRTIASVGIYYLLVVRRKLATRGAMVLTNKRLLEVFAFTTTGHYDPLEEGHVGDFSVVVRFWLFGRLSQGYVEWNNHRVFGQFKTKYGGLFVEPEVAELNCCIPMLYGMRKEYRERMKSFLLKFAQNDTQALLGDNLGGDVNANDSWTLQHWGPNEGEKPLRRIDSEFSWDCVNTCLKYTHCGVEPFVPAQEFIVSTHRLWASARASNDPWCLKDCLNARHDVIYWKPLRDIKGWRVIGSAGFREDCYTRYLCKCFNFCNPLQAYVSLEIATAKGFPVAIHRVGTYPKYGKIAEPAIHEFRELLGQVIVNANKAHNALPTATSSY